MKLNEIRNNSGAHKHKTKVGRGSSSGLGKTSGRGVKGAKARTGNQVNGFEGGQMPLQRRLPKVGFRSRKQAESQQVFLYQIAGLKKDAIDLTVLREAKLVDGRAKRVKIVKKGEIGRAVKVSGILATAGAKAAIEAAGGSVE